jgi:small subunit ribosomal protein S17
MTEASENKTVKMPTRRVLRGRVVSDRMQKTIVVEVDRRKQHPAYDKIITRTKKYLVHDPRAEAGIGDFVQIEETRPLSKRKRWRLIKVLEKASIG